MHKSTLDTLDTNWWARRDLNPEEETHNTITVNNLQASQNTDLPKDCLKPLIHKNPNHPQNDVTFEDILSQHNLSLAQAILAIDHLPIDNSTKVSLIKELATKLTESSTPESPEESADE